MASAPRARPIPQKFDLFYLKGSFVVWAWYSSRMLIGFWVGVARWPGRWWLRGPLCGLLVMLPPGFVSLGTPGCGPPCMFFNELTGVTVGLLVTGLARAVTGKDHL